MKKLSLVGLMFLVGVNVYGARGYWEDNSSLPATWTNGYVGIGTEYPYYLLDVDGTARVKGFRLTTGAHSGYVLTCGSGGVGTWQVPSGGGSCLWNVGYGGIYYNGGSVGIFNLGGSNDVSVLAISENTSTLDEFIFKGDFSGTGETGNALKLETHWADNVMTWRGDGNVGIGIDEPQSELHVLGDIQIGNNGGIYTLLSNNDFKFHRDTDPSYICQMGAGKLVFTTNGGSENPRMTIDNEGKVGIGITGPQAKLNVYGGDIQVGVNSGIYTILNNNSLKFERDNDPSYICQMGTGKLVFTTNGGPDSARMTIDNAGNVGIGTKNPQSTLAVKGKITAEEIELTATGWSDFVFADNYKLIPLEELEKHIKVNKSLPGIPTDREVLENGIEIGEIQAKFLEKIEELTLYMIELKKENKELRDRITTLEN